LSESSCDVCVGTGKNLFNETCPYCNGTGEWNDAAGAYVKNHICQCIAWDRKNCPVCKKKCHHDSHQTPKQKIEPGYGGMSSSMKNESTTPQEEEEVIIA